MIGHKTPMVEPQHQGLIIPKNFSLNFYPERVVTKAHDTNGSKSSEEQQLVNLESNYLYFRDDDLV